MDIAHEMFIKMKKKIHLYDPEKGGPFTFVRTRGYEPVLRSYCRSNGLLIRKLKRDNMKRTVVRSEVSMEGQPASREPEEPDDRALPEEMRDHWDAGIQIASGLTVKQVEDNLGMNRGQLGYILRKMGNRLTRG